MQALNLESQLGQAVDLEKKKKRLDYLGIRIYGLSIKFLEVMQV